MSPSGLQNVPSELKKWKPLSEYNKKWGFISFKPRYRLAEQLAAIDYQITLYEYLEPKWNFEEAHKRWIIIMIACVYEVALADKLSQKIFKHSPNIPKRFLKTETIERIEGEEVFEDLINDCEEAKIIDSDWKSYIHKLREVRNWLHLQKDRKDTLDQWVKDHSLKEAMDKLEEFYELIKPQDFKPEEVNIEDIPF